MAVFTFYLGLAMQLMGFAAVGLCLFSGLKAGDYGNLELWQFLGGSTVFYLGHFLKNRGR
jgi:hypothetical protein